MKTEIMFKDSGAFSDAAEEHDWSEEEQDKVYDLLDPFLTYGEMVKFEVDTESGKVFLVTSFNDGEKIPLN